MFNAESRKYFNRAYCSSGTAFNPFALREENHIEQVKQCAKTNRIDQMLQYLKTTNYSILANCCMLGYHADGDLYPIWLPTIEDNSTENAFLTKTLTVGCV